MSHNEDASPLGSKHSEPAEQEGDDMEIDDLIHDLTKAIEDDGVENVNSFDPNNVTSLHLGKWDRQLVQEARTFQNGGKLAEWLGMKNQKELDTMIDEHPIVNKVITEYNEWRGVTVTNKQPDVVSVFKAINVGELGGTAKYSHVVKADQVLWGAVQWNAWAVYTLQYELCTLRASPFHPRDWSQDIQLDRMWQLWQRIKKKRSVKQGSKLPETDPKAKEARDIEAQEKRNEQKERVEALRQADNKAAEQTIVKLLTRGKASEQAKKTKSGGNDKVSASKPSHHSANASKITSNTATRKASRHTTELTPVQQQAIEKYNEHGYNQLTNAEREALFDFAAQGLTAEEFYGNLVGSSPMSNATFIKRKDEATVQQEYRAGCEFITQVIKDERDAAVAKGLTVTEGTRSAHRLLANNPTWHWVKSVRLLVNFFEPNKKVKDAASGPAKFVVTETVQLEQATAQIASERDAFHIDQLGDDGDDAETDADRDAPRLFVTPADPIQGGKDVVKDANRLMTNMSYERSDLENACKNLKVKWDEPLRLPNMNPLGKYFLWWQLCEINAMREMVASGISIGCILASLVGLGKTMTLLGLILSYHNDRLEALVKAKGIKDPKARAEALEKVRPNKPWLVLVPNVMLIFQWCKEASDLSSVFKIYVYHKDRKVREANKSKKDTDDGDDDNDDIDEGEGIQDSQPLDGLPSNCFRHAGKLSRGSKILKRAPDDEIRIIMTTPETFRSRHGPSALRKYRKDLVSKSSKDALTKKKMHKDYDGYLFKQPDRNWKYDLSFIFFVLIYDEAHIIRNPDTTCNIGLTWLKTVYVFLATATPIWGDTGDLRGYLPLLVHPETIDIFKALPKGKKADLTLNPYSKTYRESQRDTAGQLPRDLRRLVLLPDAFEKWTVKYGSVSSGAKIEHAQEVVEAIYDEVLVRHTYSSSLVPGNPAYAIENELPACSRNHIEAYMNQDLQELYNFYSAPHVTRLRMPVTAKAYKSSKKGNDDVGINSNANRALVVGSSIPGLFLVGIPKNHECIKEQAQVIDSHRQEHISRLQDLHAERVEDGDTTGPPPTASEILGKLWPAYETEYSLMEVDIFAFLHALMSKAPKGLNAGAYMIHCLLKLAADNKGSDTAGIHPGNHYIPGVPKIPTSHADIKDSGEWVSMLLTHLKCISPRLTTLAAIILETRKRKEKASLWTAYPATQLLVHVFLTLFGLSSKMLSSSLDTTERQQLITDYNNPNGDVDYLACSYKVGSQGLNLHKGSHVLILIDAPETLALYEQVIGRGYRYGQHHDVYAYLIEAPGTYDARICSRSISKSVGEIRARIDPYELAEQTGARCPAGEDKAHFVHELKSKWAGFYLSTKKQFPLRIRHESAFELNDDGEYDVPGEYEPLSGTELSEELYNIIRGTTIAGVVPQQPPSNDNEDEDDDPVEPVPKNKLTRGRFDKGKGVEALRTVIYTGQTHNGVDLYSSKTTLAMLKEIAKELDCLDSIPKGKGRRKAEVLAAVVEAFVAPASTIDFDGEKTSSVASDSDTDSSASSDDDIESSVGSEDVLVPLRKGNTNQKKRTISDTEDEGLGNAAARDKSGSNKTNDKPSGAGLNTKRPKPNNSVDNSAIHKKGTNNKQSGENIGGSKKKDIGSGKQNGVGQTNRAGKANEAGRQDDARKTSGASGSPAKKTPVTLKFKRADIFNRQD